MVVSETLSGQAQEQIDSLADEDADSTNSEVRYMAYASRLRTALRTSTRYIAYVRCVPFRWRVFTHVLIFLVCDWWVLYRRVMWARRSGPSSSLGSSPLRMGCRGSISPGAFPIIRSRQCY